MSAAPATPPVSSSTSDWGLDALAAHSLLIDGVVQDERRLQALRQTRLLDSEKEEPYDRIARLASAILTAPVATVTLIDRDRQFYKACLGLPEPLSTLRETPLEFSFCRHTIALGTPLVIGDTFSDPRVATMRAVTDYGVRAYAGVPLMVDEQAVGTLCVMDMSPRQWTEGEIKVLSDLAAMVMTEIQLRMTIDDLKTASERAGAARIEAERANKAKTEFVAMMSHDLRTPLNAIGGYRQLLELGVHGPVNEGQLEALGRIKRAQDHLAYLISEVMDFSRLEAGSVSLLISTVSAESVVRGLETLIRPQLDEKQIEYVYTGGDRSVKMRADSEKVVRVLTNLLTNSIKFTPAGGKISLGWKSDGVTIAISVADTGIGIPTEKLDSIFEPFVQVPGQKAMNPHGVGLGLAIGKKLALLMEGDLTATSEVGKGTCFMMTVPQATTTDPAGELSGNT